MKSASYWDTVLNGKAECQCGETLLSTKEWMEAVPAQLAVIYKTTWKNSRILGELKKDEHCTYFKKCGSKREEFRELQNCQSLSTLITLKETWTNYKWTTRKHNMQAQRNNKGARTEKYTFKLRTELLRPIQFPTSTCSGKKLSKRKPEMCIMSLWLFSPLHLGTFKVRCTKQQSHCFQYFSLVLQMQKMRKISLHYLGTRLHD